MATRAKVGDAGYEELTDEQKVTARNLRADGHSIREIGQLMGNGKPAFRQTVYGPWECSRRSRHSAEAQTQRTAQLRNGRSRQRPRPRHRVAPS